MVWYDGGIKPRRPDELLRDEPMGVQDGGIIFEGTKGKLIAGLLESNPKGAQRDIFLVELMLFSLWLSG